MQDLLLILLAACGFGVAGVLGAITAKDWSKDIIDNIPSALDPYTGDIRDIRNDTAATAVSVLLYKQPSDCKKHGIQAIYQH